MKTDILGKGEARHIENEDILRLPIKYIFVFRGYILCPNADSYYMEV